MLRTALCLVLTVTFALGSANELPRLVFPVAGGVQSWNPNFGAARDGGARSHRGQDLMAPRMTPVLACFSGTVFMAKGGNAGNWLTLLGDCGWSAQYMHLNDDKTDLDDDTATKDLTYAPWLQDGGHVEAGDLLGFVGNSGNAKTSGSHLHFELHGLQGAVDPAPYLRSARIGSAPSLTVPPPTYTAPVFEERVIEKPLSLALEPLRVQRDLVVLRLGSNTRPPVNAEYIVRINHRDVATTGKSSIDFAWDTKRETNGEHLVQFLRRNIVTRGETVLESRVLLVGNGPLPVRPGISGPRLELLMAANYYRRMTGLSYLVWDDRLGRAAESHTDYWEINRSSARHAAHNEQQGNNGFTGVMPSDRSRARGYPSGVAEVMHFVGPRDAMDKLWEVPYHRMALANYAATDVGIGSAGQTVTVNIGNGPGEGVVVFPPDGMTGVPLIGNVSESPAPLRMHRGVSGRVGYVVSYMVNAPYPQRIQVTNAELRESGRVVDCYINTPGNDDVLQTGVILIPKSPLRAMTTYEAFVQAKDSRGQDVSRRWRFTTGKSETTSHTMDYREATSRTINAQPGEIKIRGSVRGVAEDGLAFSIVVEGGEGVPESAVGSTMWVGLAAGVPVRLGDDPLGIYPVRPDLTPRESVVIIGTGVALTSFSPRIVIVK